MYNNLMLYYENTMNNTKNIILITSIAAVLGFGIVAFQTNTVDALMDNTSEILDLGEKSEITTLAKPEGKGKKEPLEGVYVDGVINGTSYLNTIKCSASNILSCNIKNSGNGLSRVYLDVDLSSTNVGKLSCADKIVKDGASRASLNTRKTIHPDDCKYTTDMTYILTVYLSGVDNHDFEKYWISFEIPTEATAGEIVIDITPPEPEPEPTSS